MAGCGGQTRREEIEAHRDSQRERHLALLEAERVRILWGAERVSRET